MTAPRLEINLSRILHNVRTLVGLLAKRGISVTGVTKAMPGLGEIGRTMLAGGVTGLGDSRIENIESMRRTGETAKISLIRSPMLSQVDRVVASADVSFNTELSVIRSLSCAARKTGRHHGLVLMVELGDLREGIMPGDLEDTVCQVLLLPNVELKGIGTNLACRSGVSPSVENMAELSTLTRTIEAKFHLEVETVSGGNSANFNWAVSGAETGRVNDLRLGESMLLGREPLQRMAIDGLFTNAITLVAEVIESKVKPSLPWGKIAQSAFGETDKNVDRGTVCQSILAVGIQDTDPGGLKAPAGLTIVGASSDHLVLESLSDLLKVGSEVRLQPDYSALLRSMTSPFVAKNYAHSRVLAGQL